MRKTPGTSDATNNVGGFPNEHDGATYVGTTARGMPVYYDEASNERLTAEMREGHDAPSWTDRQQLGDDEGLSDVLGDFEWDELTDYAKAHLPGTSADENETRPDSD